METLFGIFLGIGLSSAAGFRVFVPLLAVNVAARFELLPLADGFAWMGSNPALVVFGVATLVEVLAYYIPWVDNALDAIATPTALTAGVILTAAVLTEVDPVTRWTLAILAGGSSATVFQGMTTGLRHVSSLTTGGLGNPLVSTGEAAASVSLSLLAIVMPIAAFLAVVLLLWVIGRKLVRRRRRAAA